MKTLVLIVLLASFSYADERLFSTWTGPDPDDGVPVTVTFREDGTIRIGPASEGIEFFEDLFSDTDLSFDDLRAIGYEPPTIEGISVEGTYTTSGDMLSVFFTHFVFAVDGQEIRMEQFLFDIACDLAELSSEEGQLVAAVFFVAAGQAVLFGNLFTAEEEPMIEESFHFEDGKLVLENKDGSAPLVLERVGMATAVETLSWGAVKSLR